MLTFTIPQSDPKGLNKTQHKKHFTIGSFDQASHFGWHLDLSVRPLTYNVNLSQCRHLTVLLKSKNYSKLPCKLWELAYSYVLKSYPAQLHLHVEAQKHSHVENA